MAHIAIINKDSNLVEIVLVVSNEKFLLNGAESEINGINFLKGLVSSQYPETNFYFKQCSYNGNIRKNFPGKGFKYDQLLDAFISPKPKTPDSSLIDVPGVYVLNETTCRWEFSGKLKSIRL